ncbi:hypothetical protein [Nostoc sp. C117]|uniref:hypothetical protein n=1 Tax=Nostoc sp. C117 TaxID=3349875 RepID=UPI00370D87D6
MNYTYIVDVISLNSVFCANATHTPTFGTRGFSWAKAITFVFWIWEHDDAQSRISHTLHRGSLKENPSEQLPIRNSQLVPHVFRQGFEDLCCAFLHLPSMN